MDGKLLRRYLELAHRFVQKLRLQATESNLNEPDHFLLVEHALLKTNIAEILKACVEKETAPRWYHDVDAHGTSKPMNFTIPQDRREGIGASLGHHDTEASGPIGLPIKSIVWKRLAIDTRFNTWQEKEVSMNIFSTPYQFPAPH